MTRGPDSATRLDAAIDVLLDDGTPLMSVGDGRDIELMATARLLHEVLPRFHPRFSFEERLARRVLGDGAAGATLTSEPLPLPDAPPWSIGTAPQSSLRRWSLLAGGAIASGLSLAIPLAGAALVAWRRSRPTGGVG